MKPISADRYLSYWHFGYRLNPRTTCVLNYLLWFLPDNHSFELHSPDRLHSLIVRCKSEPEAVSWYNALHTTLQKLANAAMLHANRQLQEVLDRAAIHHLGWMMLRVDQVSSYMVASCNVRIRKRHKEINWHNQSSFVYCSFIDLKSTLLLTKNFVCDFIYLLLFKWHYH